MVQLIRGLEPWVLSIAPDKPVKVVSEEPSGMALRAVDDEGNVKVLAVALGKPGKVVFEVPGCSGLRSRYSHTREVAPASVRNAIRGNFAISWNSRKRLVHASYSSCGKGRKVFRSYLFQSKYNRSRRFLLQGSHRL